MLGGLGLVGGGGGATGGAAGGGGGAGGANRRGSAGDVEEFSYDDMKTPPKKKGKGGGSGKGEGGVAETPKSAMKWETNAMARKR